MGSYANCNKDEIIKLLDKGYSKVEVDKICEEEKIDKNKVVDCSTKDSGQFCQGCKDVGNDLSICRTKVGRYGSCGLSACLHSPKYDKKYDKKPPKNEK